MKSGGFCLEERREHEGLLVAYLFSRTAQLPCSQEMPAGIGSWDTGTFVFTVAAGALNC